MLLNTYNHRYTFSISYLVYLSPYIGLGPFMLHMCDLFLIFSLIFIAINKLIQTYALVFAFFLEYVLLFLEDSLDDKSE